MRPSGSPSIDTTSAASTSLVNTTLSDADFGLGFGGWHAANAPISPRTAVVPISVLSLRTPDCAIDSLVRNARHPR